MTNSINDFVERLSLDRPSGFWNMYGQTNPELDPPNAHHERSWFLEQYLESRQGAKYCLVGLAPGYAGARFSGEPFNDEVHLYARHGIRLSKRLRAWQEDTATVVQNAINRLGIQEDMVCWNALPLHPWVITRPLSNRTPEWSEVEHHGLHWLQEFLGLLQPGIVIPVGRIAERALTTIGINNVAPYVRHPSHGGSTLFFRGLLTIVNGKADAEEEQPREDG